MKLTSLSIIDFKKFDNFSIDNLEAVNQICGNNGSGKTSVYEALKFLFLGSGKNKDLVKEGKERCEVRGKFVTEDGDEYELVRFVTSSGKGAFSISRNGDNATEEKQTFLGHIRSMLGIGSFDPNELLDDENVFAQIKNLCDKPLKIDEVKSYIEEFVGQDAKEELVRDYSKEPAIDALLDIQETLKGYRRTQGQFARQHEAILDDRKQEEALTFKELTDLSKNFSISNVSETLEELQIKRSKIKESADELERLQTAVQNKKLKVEDLKRQLEFESEQLTTFSTQLAELKVQDDDRAIDAKINYLLKKQELKNKKASTEVEEKRANAYRKNFEKANDFVNKKFQLLFDEYITNIKEKLPGLSFSEGVWLFNNVPISKLSSAERTELAIKFIQLRGSNSNIICIDNAEHLDENTVDRLNFESKSQTFFLFKVGSPFKMNSNVVQLK